MLVDESVVVYRLLSQLLSLLLRLLSKVLQLSPTPLSLSKHLSNELLEALAAHFSFTAGNTSFLSFISVDDNNVPSGGEANDTGIGVLAIEVMVSDRDLLS